MKSGYKTRGWEHPPSNPVRGQLLTRGQGRAGPVFPARRHPVAPLDLHVGRPPPPSRGAGCVRASPRPPAPKDPTEPTQSPPRLCGTGGQADGDTSRLRRGHGALRGGDAAGGCAESAPCFTGHAHLSPSALKLGLGPPITGEGERLPPAGGVTRWWWWPSTGGQRQASGKPSPAGTRRCLLICLHKPLR